jgi:hypothetical protein
MSTNLERFKSDLAKLTSLGNKMSADLILRVCTPEQRKECEDVLSKAKANFEGNYQKWYTEAHAVLKQLVPDRLEEFIRLYHGDGKRKQIDSASYHIQDWLTGVRAGKNHAGQKCYNDGAIVAMRFKTQLEILESVESRFESSLFDIAQLVRADLFDSELDAARELAKNGLAER